VDDQLSKVDDQLSRVDDQLSRVDDQLSRVDDQLSRVDDRRDFDSGDAVRWKKSAARGSPNPEKIAYNPIRSPGGSGKGAGHL
jgi:hypothetical protein